MARGEGNGGGGVRGPSGRLGSSSVGDEPEPAATVEVHLWAAARDAAGTDVIHVPAGTMREVLDAAVAATPPRFADVLARCSLLLDSVAVHDDAVAVAPGQRVDVLPPFAGGAW